LTLVGKKLLFADNGILAVNFLEKISSIVLKALESPNDNPI